MGETSSAKPAELARYSRQGVERCGIWDAEVPALGAALEALRRAMPSGLPQGCSVYVEALDVSFGGLARDVRHLDEWVGDVADGFAAADRGPFGLDGRFDLIDPSRVVTVDSDRIHVGAADRAASEAQGRADAQALAALLANEGFLNWYDIENDRDALDDLADRYPGLRDLLQHIGAHADDEDYCAALYNYLGRDGLQKLGDLVNQLGIASDRGYLRDDAYGEFVVPLADTLSAAERSGHLVNGVLDGLFDFGHGVDPDWQADVYDQDENYLMQMRRRSLGLLLFEGDWSSAFTASAADAITFQFPVTDHLHAYEGFTSGLVVIEDHPELASTEWMAMSALARDDRAGNLYLSMDHFNDGWHENVGLLVHISDATLPAQSSVAGGHLGISPSDFDDRYFATVADVLDGGLFRYPLATGTTYSPETTRLVSQTMQSAGEGGVLDDIKRVLARMSAPYTQDLAVDTQDDRRDLPPSRLVLTPEEVSAFFKELSFDEQARITLTLNAAAFVRGEIQGAAPDIAAERPNAVGTEIRLSVGLYASLGEAMHAAMNDRLAEREAVVSAWRSVTDPIVELVTGKVVERIPVVSTAANLPVMSAIVDGVTDSLDDAVNSAIYDNAIPRPEVEHLSTWEAAMGPGVRDAIVEALYADPATRASLAGPDWSGSLEQFRALPPVQDATNQYSQQIITGFDARAAFDELFD